MAQSDRPRHLLTVWNPSYAADAMDAHLRLLCEWSERHRRGRVTEEEVFVWWGKVRSPSRTAPLPHLGEILALDDQVRRGVETHLYLTDYRSLYVGKVGEITTDAVTEDDAEWDHVPAYLRGHVVELWFYLEDIRRLVSDDTVAVIDELRRLHNVRFHDAPVSLYGGMVELPLIVTRDPEVSWFPETGTLTEGQLWAERDAELRGEVERLARELRDNLFGLEVWGVLETSTRAFVATGEAVYRTRRDDPGFDLSATVVQYAKALETELNALLFPAAARVLARAPVAERRTMADNRPLDLGTRVPHQSLGAMVTLLKHDEVLHRALRIALPNDWKWLFGELPAHLDPILDVRNPGAHSQAVTADRVRPLRASVLGIGCEGLLVRLARARLRAG